MEENNNILTEEVKRLTMVERIKYFFTNPNKLFEDYNIRPTWVLKFLVIIALSIVYIIAMKTITIDPSIDMMIQQTPDMTKEQVDASVAFMKSPVMLAIYIGTAILMSVISVFLTSLIYLGLISLFGGKTKYMKIVSVYTLAYLPYYVGTFIALAFAYFSNNYDALLQPTLSDVLFNRFDLFVIWQVLLLVFGFAKISNIKIQKSAIIVAIMWAIATGISLIPVFMNRMF